MQVCYMLLLLVLNVASEDAVDDASSGPSERKTSVSVDPIPVTIVVGTGYSVK